jgi:hypothetical protein
MLEDLSKGSRIKVVKINSVWLVLAGDCSNTFLSNAVYVKLAQ